MRYIYAENMNKRLELFFYKQRHRIENSFVIELSEIKDGSTYS